MTDPIDPPDDDVSNTEDASDVEEELDHLHESERTAVECGETIRCRAYLEEVEGEYKEFILWQIGSAMGDRAILDVRESEMFLPHGRKVHFDGEPVSHLKIPRHLTEVLVQDFEDLHDQRDADDADESESPASDE